VVRLCDAALSVSGAQERGGARVDHVIDRRAGASRCAALRAAVVGSSARQTDIWSTALLVIGQRPASMPADLATLIERSGAEGSHIDVHDRAGPVFGCGPPGDVTLGMTA
jgi:thiamine biosynthesis lipoprotein ApbE